MFLGSHLIIIVQMVHFSKEHFPMVVTLRTRFYRILTKQIYFKKAFENSSL